MEIDIRNKILNGAIAIAEELLKETEKDEAGYSWKVVATASPSGAEYKKGESIYGGNAGIALFFLELYQHTQENKYQQAAKEGIKWAVNFSKKNEVNSYALYTGKMGVSMACIRFYELTNDKKYLSDALELSENCESSLNQYYQVDDLINGISGTLIGLLHLHAVTQEQKLLPKIEVFAKELIKRAYVADKGLYWDRSEKNIHGLCGYSHGAAGIGLVFLELGNYFANEAFYQLAKEAFAYESQQYDARINNWPDFRKGLHTADDKAEHEKAFLQNDKAKFVNANDMNAWCHGAAGIGLSRIRAIELLQSNEQYKKELGNAIKRTAAYFEKVYNENSTYNLCHGGGGNADLFIEAGGNEWSKLSEQMALNALKSREINGHYISGFHANRDVEDNSLFMGKAGVGYFYLRILNPQLTPSILLPRIRKKRSVEYFPLQQLTWGNVANLVLQRNYKRTLAIAHNIASSQVTDFFNSFPVQTEFSIETKFETFIKKLISELNTNGSMLNDIFQLEYKKTIIDKTIESHSYYYIKSEYYRKVISQNYLNTGDIHNKILVTDKEISLLETAYNWDLEKNVWEENIHEQVTPDSYKVLLKPALFGTQEFCLNIFSYTLFEFFSEKKEIGEGIRDLIECFEDLSEEDILKIKQSAYHQIDEMLKMQVLLPA